MPGTRTTYLRKERKNHETQSWKIFQCRSEYTVKRALRNTDLKKVCCPKLSPILWSYSAINIKRGDVKLWHIQGNPNLGVKCDIISYSFASTAQFDLDIVTPPHLHNGRYYCWERQEGVCWIMEETKDEDLRLQPGWFKYRVNYAIAFTTT